MNDNKLIVVVFSGLFFLISVVAAMSHFERQANKELVSRCLEHNYPISECRMLICK